MATAYDFVSACAAVASAALAAVAAVVAAWTTHSMNKATRRTMFYTAYHNYFTANADWRRELALNGNERYLLTLERRALFWLIASIDEAIEAGDHRVSMFENALTAFKKGLKPSQSYIPSEYAFYPRTRRSVRAAMLHHGYPMRDPDYWKLTPDEP